MSSSEASHNPSASICLCSTGLSRDVVTLVVTRVQNLGLLRITPEHRKTRNFLPA